jgi:hypothetical protein
VGLLLGLRLPGGGSISQEVRPENKMAADSQNGYIITLSVVMSYSVLLEIINVPGSSSK